MLHGTSKVPYARALVRARMTSSGFALHYDLVALRLGI